MRWVAKAMIQKAISFLPQGEEVNYFFQRRIRRSLPRPDRYLQQNARQALEHLGVIRKHRPTTSLRDAVFFEFGAGWDLVIPLMFYSFGVDHQILVDVRPNLRLELVNDSVRRLNRWGATAGAEEGLPFRALPEDGFRSAIDLKEVGIDYRAPVDARRTGLPPESVDIITSTHTLEHIPGPGIQEILLEASRILKTRGLVSCRIDFKDHYSYVDESISAYNFLKFRAGPWRLLNSSIHFQNRLRYPDYKRIFEQSNLECLDENIHRPNEEQLATLERLKISRWFRDRYSLEDLGIRGLDVVLQKSHAPTPV